MYGLIGKMRSVPGKREELLALVFTATSKLPGCLSYIVARDPVDTTALWITEVWTDAASHKASLALPEVQAAITKARPLIVGFEFQVETEPVGGIGLP
ncbi:MAG: putative quinol monooxygenase [Mesorhizobium sp.]|jgi:quinol monooxygenase YgiN|uniref:Quinol monooxygenase n=1 Tax=Aquamicrobium soli TaxID=1811518 RepID=A0ABV7K702_9HYPH